MRRRAFHQSPLVADKNVSNRVEAPEPPILELDCHDDRHVVKRGLGTSVMCLLLLGIIVDSVGVAINYQAFRSLEHYVPLTRSLRIAGGTLTHHDYASNAPRTISLANMDRSSVLFDAKRGRTIDDMWLGAHDDNYKYYGPMKLLRNPVTLGGKNGEKDEVCKPAAKWQEDFYPNCNDFHAVDFASDMTGGDYNSNSDEKTPTVGLHSVEMLGIGTMRDAWKLTSGTDQVVLKTLQLHREFSERTTYYQIVDAVATERLTSSPHVQDIYGFCGSSVYNELGREFQLEEDGVVPIMDRLKYARDLAAGLADAHGISGPGEHAHLVHADLRQSNVLFSLKDKSLKLSDFNQGYLLGWNEKEQEMCGYRPNFSFWQDDFAAPEECLGKVQTEKTDIFHMGGIIYYLLTMTKPYANEENPEAVRRTVAKEGKWPSLRVPRSIWISRHPALLAMREALEACLQNKPQKRASAREVFEILDKTYQELTTCKASPLQNTTDPSNFKSTLPNVLLVGAQKSGTTATASFIFHHRNVCKPVSALDDEFLKELHFYDDPKNFNQGLELYGKHFCHCGDNSHVMDATPDYMQYAKQAKETYEKLGPTHASKVKVVLVLREPVDREFSWYNHMTVDIRSDSPTENGRGYTSQVVDSKSGKVLSFDEYVEKHVLKKIHESQGQYAKWIQEWMDAFGRDKVLVLAYEELVQNQPQFMKRLRSFLSLQQRPDGGPHYVTEQNKKIHTKKPPLLCKTQAKLAKAFAKANQDLYDLLDKHPGPDSEQRPFPKFQLSPCNEHE